MTPDLFERFIPFFVQAGRDITVKLEDGSTFLDLVREHRRGGEYAEVLEEAGAKSGRTPG